MGTESAFVDLRRLADWFTTLAAASQRPAVLVERIVHRLGATCVPLLGREICERDARRRDAARAALEHLAAGDARPRVIAELRRIAASDTGDDGKLCALGLLGELGVSTQRAARFADPSAIQRRSARALAAQLETPGDVAAAADLMVRQLAADDLVKLLEVTADVAPGAAHRLGVELCARLDVADELRDRIANAAVSTDDAPAPRRPARPTQITILVDASARLVVVASRKISGERRWRRWAVLIGSAGAIDDCIHEDSAGDVAQVVARLVADGYRVASSDGERARAIVAAAARQTRGRLTSAYYLGRDLLELGEAHLGGSVRAGSTALGRAIELIADDELARARSLLARAGDGPDAAAALAACALAEHRPADALAPLGRAIEAEPEWPLHHWNLAVACHQLGDARGCYHALVRFVATSAAPTGLYGDPDQPARVGAAERLIAELERTSRLTGQSLGPRRRRRRATSSKSRVNTRA